MRTFNPFNAALGTLVLSAGMMMTMQSLSGQKEHPTESVRPQPSREVRTSVTGLLGWSVGVPSEAFQQLTFTEAAIKTDALGFAFIEGYDTQKTSPEIAKNLDYALTQAESGGS